MHRSPPRAFAFTAMWGALALSCGGGETPDRTGADARVPAGVVEDLLAGGNRSLIVELDESALGSTSSQALAVEPTSPEQSQLAVEGRAVAYDRAKSDMFAAIVTADATVKDAYHYLPAAHVEVKTLAGLEQLLARPEVLRIHEDAPHTLSSDPNLALIGQPAAASAGKTGQGTTVVVLDTGVDYRRPDFGSCSAPGIPSATCRVVYAADVAPDDGSLDDNGHGTNVSAIVAAVAPGAKLAVLDVFRGAYAYTSDLLTAIDWAVSHRAAYNIVAINMSLGGGSSSTPCATDVFASSLAAARAAGIVPVVAAGNDGNPGALSSPACVPAALSVGAVYAASYGGLRYSTCTDPTTAADQVTCFSNSASFLGVLAPGALITAGGTTMAGTSQATPHVAGAVAVLRAAFPGDTPDQVVARLRSTGKPVRDNRNGVTTPRIDLAAAVGSGACSYKVSPSSLLVAAGGGSGTISVTTAAGCSWSVTSTASWLSSTPASGSGPASVKVLAGVNPGAARLASLTVAGTSIPVQQLADTTPPTGTLSIDAGQKVTNKPQVTLSVSATDAGGVASMCVSNATTCTAWAPFATTKTWTLTSGSETKTVRAWFKDNAGNVSAPAAATIVLDTVAPTNGKLTATAARTSVVLTWSGFGDALSGIASYTLVYAKGGVPASCSTGTPIYAGPASTFSQAGLSSSTTYGYRVCAADRAGNVATGATSAITTKP